MKWVQAWTLMHFVQTIREVAPPAIQEELLRDRMQPKVQCRILMLKACNG
jgi:hypothetical protein